MNDGFGLLINLAEVSVALAGFSAIVVLLKRDEQSRWSADDRNRFHGMVLHAIAAVLFALLPVLLDAFISDRSVLWSVASALLGIQILMHAVGVAFWIAQRIADRLVMVLGTMAGALLLATAAGLPWAANYPTYVVGVLWHTAQAALLFCLLIWIDPSRVRADDD